MKRNVPVLGFILGIIMPLLGLLLFYLVKFSGMGMEEFISVLLRNHEETAKILSLALIANLIPFIYYTSKRLDLTARGVLISTMLYAVLIVLLKFVW